MALAYLQEAYLLEEPGDHEVIKHDRAHHRNYSSNSLRSNSHQGTSRIRRFLKKSIPSRQPTVESDLDIHTELPIKSPFSRDYGSTPAGDTASLDIKPLSKSLSQPLSRLSRSVSRRSLVERFAPDKITGSDRLSINQAVTEAGQELQPATEELSCNPSTSTLSDHSAKDTEPSQSTLSPPAPENSTRKPRLSISKNLIQYCLPSPKPPPPAWSSNQNAASQMSLCSAESETYSESGPVTSPADSTRSNPLMNNLRKLTLNPKRNLAGTSNASALAEFSPPEYPFPDPLPITRREAVLNQEYSHTALDHRWFATTRGERYHPYLRSDVPYWMSYGPEIMNNHILMQYASAILEGSLPFQLMSPSPGMHNTKNEIRRVLDIGCGPSATWCVGVLRQTSGIEVVGLDICPLLLDLEWLERSVSENLSFVQHDFSDCTLPFETGHFDYVHASFISSGIPEHKWASMIEEMTRVLKRHGTLELLESNTLIADPSKAKDPNGSHDETKPATSCCRVPAASALINTPTATPRQLDLLKESTSEVCPTTVQGMIDKLLEQHFISPYPLSLLPTEISNVTTSMKRPLAKQFIKFPSDLQSFVDTQTKSPDRINAYPQNASQEPMRTQDPDVKAAADECMAMLLLHSHIDAMYSNKEISWYDLWLPSISCEPASSNLPSPSVKRTRPTQSRMPSSFGRHFPQNRRTKYISPTQKMKSEYPDRSVYDEKPEIYSTKSISLFRESQLNFHEKVKSMSHVNLNSNVLGNSSTLDLLQDQRDSVYHHQHEPEKLNFTAVRDSSSKIFTHRKKFDQIWDNWKEDLSCHSLGISKLLELRFGWTCTMDIENHKALYEHYEFYQQELAQCEGRINELRLKLHELKFVQIIEVEGNLDEDPNSNPTSASPFYIHRPQSFEYKTSSEGNEDFEHVNFAKNLTDRLTPDTSTSADPRKLLFGPENPMTSYGSNVVHHEPDSQSLEELGYDILKEASNTRSRTRQSSENTGPLSSGRKSMRLPRRKKPIREQPDSDSEETSMNDCPISLKVFLSGSRIPLDHTSSKEEETEAGLEIEIESLTRQKADIKKAIQLIQTDLDNVTKRLGLFDPEDHQVETLTVTGTRDSRQTIPEETELDQLTPTEDDEDRSAPTEVDQSKTNLEENGEDKVLSSSDPKETSFEEKDENCGMLDELFLPFERLEFPSFLSEDINKPTSPVGPLIQQGVIKEVHEATKEVHEATKEVHKATQEHEATKAVREDLTSRISIFNRKNPCRMSNLSNQLTKNTKDLRFTNVGFGDLRIEKFYSVKKN
ncbi:hypothetical protein PtB15_15B204 [Puccinia triticina]|nr:hypothetical protein PtB15_15B204 [Puccinia triticina]